MCVCVCALSCETWSIYIQLHHLSSHQCNIQFLVTYLTQNHLPWWHFNHARLQHRNSYSICLHGNFLTQSRSQSYFLFPRPLSLSLFGSFESCLIFTRFFIWLFVRLHLTPVPLKMISANQHKLSENDIIKFQTWFRRRNHLAYKIVNLYVR